MYVGSWRDFLTPQMADLVLSRVLAGSSYSALRTSNGESMINGELNVGGEWSLGALSHLAFKKTSEPSSWWGAWGFLQTDSNPRYHARKSQSKGSVQSSSLAGSATKFRIEARAAKGFMINSSNLGPIRQQNSKLKSLISVSILAKEAGNFTPVLVEAIADRLQKKSRSSWCWTAVIYFQLCHVWCGTVDTCPNCDISLTSWILAMNCHWAAHENVETH